MRGRNTITLCPAEMQAAMQHYFRTVIFRAAACPEDKAVKQANGVDASFVVEVEGSKD